MKLPIVVGTDLTEESDAAVVQAEARARRDGTELTVVHAMSALLWGTPNEAEYLAQLRRRIREQVMALTGRPEHSYDVAVERGPIHTVLPRFAASKGALLVIGAHMHHGLAHALRRDESERVVQFARGPVLVARPSRSSNHIVAAVDRPFNAAPALDVAIEEARSAGATLTVLHCVNTGFIETIAADLINGGAYAPRPLGQRSPVAEAAHALREELSRRDVNADIRVVEGEAQSAIWNNTTRLDAQLLVVGSTRYPASTPHVTAAVLRRAPCSVLIVDEEVSNQARAHAQSASPS